MMLHDNAAAEDPTQQNEGAELVKRFRKLRCIGMDAEAEQLQLQIKSCGFVIGESVVASPPDTD